MVGAQFKKELETAARMGSLPVPPPSPLFSSVQKAFLPLNLFSPSAFHWM